MHFGRNFEKYKEEVQSFRQKIKSSQSELK